MRSLLLPLLLLFALTWAEVYPTPQVPYPPTERYIQALERMGRHAAARHPEHLQRATEQARAEIKRELRQDRGARSAGLKSLPVGGYIRWFRTHCNSTDNPQNYYTQLNHQAYSTVASYVNDVLGGMLINGTRYLIDDVNLNDGADCSLMQILYERAYTELGIDKFFAPTQPDCSVLAKWVESKAITGRPALYANAADYSLLILAFTNTSQANDANALYVDGNAYSYSNLQWTYNMMNDITQGGQSCAEAMTNPIYIDQTGAQPGVPNRIRTMAMASNDLEEPYLVQQVRQALLMRNVTELVPYQSWSLPQIVSEQCDYLNPTMERWVAANPDFIDMTTGASNGSIGFDCMHLLRFQPKLTMMPTYPIDPAYIWQTAGMLGELPFQATTNYPDPVLTSYSTFVAYYGMQWNQSVDFYELTFAASAVVLLDCINATQSLDNYVLRECIRAFNGTTIFGDLFFNQQFWFVDRPNVCLQRQTNGTFLSVFPMDYPGRVPVVMSSLFTFNETWWTLKHPARELSGGQVAAIAIGACIGFLVLCAVVAVIVYFIVTRFIHIVTVKKDTWETATS